MLEEAGGNICASVGEEGIVIVHNQFAPLAYKIQVALKEEHHKILDVDRRGFRQGQHRSCRQGNGRTRAKQEAKRRSARLTSLRIQARAWPALTLVCRYALKPIRDGSGSSASDKLTATTAWCQLKPRSGGCNTRYERSADDDVHPLGLAAARHLPLPAGQRVGL